MKINPAQLGAVNSLKPTMRPQAEKQQSALKLRDAYRDFVGKTFFSQLLKSMRSTVGKPAYFHGGQAEEVFRSQLDQHLADNMSDASASRIADPMFRQQFPQHAKLLAAHEQSHPALANLESLRRR
jgi:Rod binding domain-containing protein